MLLFRTRLEMERGLGPVVKALVVGALNDHGHDLRRAVDRGHGEGVGQRVTRPQGLDRGIVGVEDICPRAAGRHRETAVAVVARLRTCRGREGVVGIVDVPLGQGAAGAWRGFAGIAWLGHASANIAADDRGVVGALDGDRHRLCRTVRGPHGEIVSQRLTCVQRLHRAVAVVEREGPVPIRGHGEAAVTVVARLRTFDGIERVRRAVDVGGGQKAARGWDALRGIVGSACFDHATMRVPGDDGRIVGALDGHRDDLRRAADGGHGEGVCQGLARR